MGADLDPDATPGRADFESGLAGGKRIGAGLVGKVYCDQKPRIASGAVVAVSDGFQINLIPVMRPVLPVWLALVQVLNPIAEGIDSLRQMPGGDAAAIVWVMHYG